MVTTLLEIAVGFSLLLTLHSFINVRFFFLAADVSKKSSSSFDILIPARNEENAIEACIKSTISQLDDGKSRIFVFDDNSTDETPRILESFAEGDITILTNNQNPPEGWLGKNWACDQLAQESSAEYLVFLDADVILSPAVVSPVISLMQLHSLDLVSPYPMQISKGILGHLIQPLLQWSWLTTVPMSIARKNARPSMAVANGQFLVVRREAYFACGGHSAVKDKVLDDIELLRLLLAHGFSGGVIDGTHLATCTMYQDNQELTDGYSKSLWCAFGGPLGSIATIGFLLFVYVSPLAGLFTGHTNLAILGWTSGFFGRIITGHKTGQLKIISALSHPISIICFTYLNLVSWWRQAHGELAWKGRKL